MRTPYILRLENHRYRVVFADHDANQTTTPLTPDHAPAHSAFVSGTDAVCIRRMARHPGSASYRSLRDVAECFMLTESQVAAARKRGAAVQRAGQVAS